MISLELSSIQAKDAERAMIREAMASYTGQINVITPPPTGLQSGQWRGVNQIALPGSSTNSRSENDLLAKVGRMRELVSVGAKKAAIAKALKMRVSGVEELARVHGVELNG